MLSVRVIDENEIKKTIEYRQTAEGNKKCRKGARTKERHSDKNKFVGFNFN